MSQYFTYDLLAAVMAQMQVFLLCRCKGNGFVAKYLHPLQPFDILYLDNKAYVLKNHYLCGG